MTTGITDELAADLVVFTEERTAELLSLGVNTLQSLRRKGIGPRVTVLSTGRLGYQPRHVRQWLDAQVEGATPTADARAAARRVVVKFIEALSRNDYAAADALIPATAANVVALEAAGLVIRALQLAEDPEAAFHALREIVTRD